MVHRLREDREAIGLTSALGWYVTKHALGLYSSMEPPAPYRDLAPEVDRPPARTATAIHIGPATVESYTVNHGADGPESVILTALTADGTRALARTTDQALLDLALTGDALGATIAFADGAGKIAVARLAK